MFNKNNKKGFTLVELLVVIAIIGILAVVAVPSLMKNIEKSKAAKFVADYSAVKSAVMAEYAENPTTTSTTLLDGNLSTSLVEDLSSSTAADYILDVTTSGTNITSVNLTIQTNNKNVAAKVVEQITSSLGLTSANATSKVVQGTSVDGTLTPVANATTVTISLIK